MTTSIGLLNRCLRGGGWQAATANCHGLVTCRDHRVAVGILAHEYRNQRLVVLAGDWFDGTAVLAVRDLDLSTSPVVLQVRGEAVRRQFLQAASANGLQAAARRILSEIPQRGPMEPEPVSGRGHGLRSLAIMPAAGHAEPANGLKARAGRLDLPMPRTTPTGLEIQIGDVATLERLLGLTWLPQVPEAVMAAAAAKSPARARMLSTLDAVRLNPVAKAYVIDYAWQEARTVPGGLPPTDLAAAIQADAQGEALRELRGSLWTGTASYTPWSAPVQGIHVGPTDGDRLSVLLDILAHGLLTSTEPCVLVWDMGLTNPLVREQLEALLRAGRKHRLGLILLAEPDQADALAVFADYHLHLDPSGSGALSMAGLDAEPIDTYRAADIHRGLARLFLKEDAS